MRYLLLIYTEEPSQATPEDTVRNETQAYDAFTRELHARGAFRAGEALHLTSAATTVRVKDGETIATDGPFAETKEALGGFYLIDVADLDEAIGLAAKIPGATHGSIEIRPIYEYGAAETTAADAAGVGA